MSVSLVILNADIITLNRKKPKAEAVAVQNGRITAVGSNSEIRKLLGDCTKVVDAKGACIVPGLVDCHVHMTEFGFFLQRPDMKNARSISEMQEKLRRYASRNKKSGWIQGGRWDHEKFAEKRYPTRWDLDEAVSDRPVFLLRVCGHMGVANSEALRLAGITEESRVPGGKIELDESNGQPNGLLKEKAMQFIWKVIPKPTQKTLEEASLLACNKAVRAGLTAVHWMVDSTDEIQAIINLESKEKLPIRVCLGLPPKLEADAHQLLLSSNSQSKIKIGFVKLFADGSLGSRTAALKEPYSDDPRTSGMLVHSSKELYQLILEAHQSGNRVAVHAIGDRAVEGVQDAYEKVLERFPRKDHRHRIEHCSILNPQIIKRMNTLGLTVSIQPHFVVSDFWLIDRVGKDRARWAFPFKSLVTEGLAVISGSDCPVEKIDPLLGIWAAVAERDNGEGLTAEQTLKTYTINAAYATEEEDERGTIEVGKLADFTVLNSDILKVPAHEIKKVKVQMTIVGGKIVNRRSAI
jgi:predicted amidohydrolase YtcJ